MINRDQDLPIKRQAKLPGMSRGSVYYLPRAVSQANLALMGSIDKLHLEHPFMGARHAIVGNAARRLVHQIEVQMGGDFGCGIFEVLACAPGR